MRWTMIGLGTVAALAAVSCSDPSQKPNPEARRTFAVASGKLYSGHPAVGLVRNYEGGVCTGTLVGVRTVLTAAHCLNSAKPHYQFSLDNGEKHYSVREFKHPQYAGAVTSNDVALLVLGSTPSVEPVVLSNTKPNDDQQFLLVGYGNESCTQVNGQQQCTGLGVKRSGVNRIAKVFGEYFSSFGTPNACYGDSGGPVFGKFNNQEVQIGTVAGTTLGDGCKYESIYTRVDRHISWLQTISNGDLQVQDGPPSVQIISPLDKATVSLGSSPVIVDWRAPRDIVSMALFVDGKMVYEHFNVQQPEKFDGSWKKPGTYTVRAAAKDDRGAVGNHTITVTVVDSQVEPDAGISPDVGVWPDMSTGSPSNPNIEGGCSYTLRTGESHDAAVFWIALLVAIAAARRRRKTG